MRYSEEDHHARALRRVRASVQTLIHVADELDDPEDVDRRADLLIAIEDLADVTNFLLEATRAIAWRDVITETEDHEIE
jgi:hypothetical protein